MGSNPFIGVLLAPLPRLQISCLGKLPKGAIGPDGDRQRITQVFWLFRKTLKKEVEVFMLAGY
jgi:hypothetical protein